MTASVTSALDQTDADLEVVLVEQRGTGAELDAGDPRIRGVACDDSDFATQANRALASIRSPLVKLLPAGDRLAPGCVAAQVAALDARGDVGVVFAAVECVDESGRSLGTDASFETSARTGEELLPALLGGLRLAPAATLARRELLLEAGGLDPLYVRAPVHDLWLRALASNAAVFLADRLARVRPCADDPVERAERGLAALRALSRSGIDRFLAGLGGAVGRSDGERAAARLALVDAVLASGNEALLPIVSGLVEEARTLGGRIGTARAERLVAAGLPGLASIAAGLAHESRSGRAPRGRVVEVGSRAGVAAGADSARSSAIEASEHGAVDGLAVQELRARRRLHDRLTSATATEAEAASRMTVLTEESRRRVADAATAGGEVAVSGERLLAQSSRIAALAEQMLEKLRIGKRFRRATAVGAAAPLAAVSAEPSGGGMRE